MRRIVMMVVLLAVVAAAGFPRGNADDVEEDVRTIVKTYDDAVVLLVAVIEGRQDVTDVVVNVCSVIDLLVSNAAEAIHSQAQQDGMFRQNLVLPLKTKREEYAQFVADELRLFEAVLPDISDEGLHYLEHFLWAQWWYVNVGIQAPETSAQRTVAANASLICEDGIERQRAGPMTLDRLWTRVQFLIGGALSGGDIVLSYFPLVVDIGGLKEAVTTLSVEIGDRVTVSAIRRLRNEPLADG